MPLRFGILGTARINRRLIPAIRASARCELRAVASRDRARAEASARRWEIPTTVEGYTDLIARDDIDAVYIPLPNSLHVEWTLAAVAAGKHVLCEKPIALDPADVDRIEAAALSAGVVVEEGYMYRHEPLTRRVVDLVVGGAVGEPRAIVSGFTFALTDPGNVRFDPDLGGGALWDLGGYPVSYANLLAGSDPTVALGDARWTSRGVDDEFTGVLRFDRGLSASIYAGFRAEYRTWLEILGSTGSVIVPSPFRPAPRTTITLERATGVESIDVAGSEVLFVKQVEDFVASVLDSAPPIVPLAESRRTIASQSRLYASARARGGILTP